MGESRHDGRKNKWRLIKQGYKRAGQSHRELALVAKARRGVQSSRSHVHGKHSRHVHVRTVLMVAGLAVSCASSRGYVGRLRSLAHGKQSGDMGMFETNRFLDSLGLESYKSRRPSDQALPPLTGGQSCGQRWWRHGTFCVPSVSTPPTVTCRETRRYGGFRTEGRPEPKKSPRTRFTLVKRSSSVARLSCGAFRSFHLPTREATRGERKSSQTECLILLT